MDTIKIVFFDIDGTLVDMETKAMSPRTLETLRRLQAGGIKICIATGRSPVSLPVFEGVTFDAYLTFNGSLCYDASGILYSHPIPGGDVRKIIDNAARLGRPVSVATKSRLAANGLDRDLAEYYAFAHLKLTAAEDFREALREEIYQVMLGCREPDYPAILEGVEGAEITAWWDRAVDIIPKGGGKGVAVRKLLDHYHLDRSQALAFGDGNNDLEMLKAVGTGIAMGNASPRLKEAASEVCGPVSEDGIYHYCLSHGLI